MCGWLFIDLQWVSVGMHCVMVYEYVLGHDLWIWTVHMHGWVKLLFLVVFTDYTFSGSGKGSLTAGYSSYVKNLNCYDC